VGPARADPDRRRPERAADPGVDGPPRSCSCSTPAATTCPTRSSGCGGSWTAAPAPTSPNSSASPGRSTLGPTSCWPTGPRPAGAA
jgi:hypothetical protein